MGLEWRNNGLYYYEKKRVGQKVVSVYAGKGEIALLRYRLVLLDQQERERERFTCEDEIRRYRTADEMLNQFCEEADAVEDALFLINGYHQHSRTWRRKRIHKKN